ncbi:M66 family metalloprotease [Erwinia mallotivora]|uniref:M66 family metalloprotease n=1 Tax=Erwinia mallotivora TaxID=69222 RepID=UPI0021C20974|nr:M66 family metalloprotease [Erwinia mallotivora]
MADYVKRPENVFKVNTEQQVFNESDNGNDLKGTLQANVKFVQSQIIPAHPKSGDQQPHLIAGRKTLLLVKPQGHFSQLHVSLYDQSGNCSGKLPLLPPEQLPKSAYYVNNVPDDITFSPLPGSTLSVSTSAQLTLLSDPTAAFLLSQLQNHSVVEIRTADGRWTRNIFLPENGVSEGKLIRVISNAGYTSTITFSGRTTIISRGDAFHFKYISGQWILDTELANQGITYALNTWSLNIPGRWIKPGISLNLEADRLSGQLDNINVGAPTELLIHTIDIGMLTTPRHQFSFADDTEAHREYFQTAPISRMIVSNYESIHLTEVRLPDGRLLTDFDPSQGGIYDGTMRQRIGKELISLGINNANYGINSSEGEGEWSPYLTAQLTAHNSRGNYANGVVIHGLSGGGGIVTLEDSLGNEFSHEVGHNYGLGHYPGGFDGSVHQSADSINSTWGWDSDRNYFLPNFSTKITQRPSCYGDRCQSPFYGRSYGFDPMAGGEPMAPINRFTLYTPYTAAIIQQFMESKLVFSPDSVTGFRKWDATTQRMQPCEHRINVVSPVTISNRELSEQTFTSLLNHHQVVKVYMADGNWAQNIPVPPASALNRHKIITVEHHASWNSELHLNGKTILVTKGFSQSYRSEEAGWTACILVDADTRRIYAGHNQLGAQQLSDLLARYQLVTLSPDDKFQQEEIHLPAASRENDGKTIRVENSTSHMLTLVADGQSVKTGPGEERHFFSDGGKWLDNLTYQDNSVAVKPVSFGVPVTTLVGYYDPEGKLPASVFPALHGAYGYLYQEPPSQLTDTDCQLIVESENQVLRFRLENKRLRSGVMNKFHVNIAESQQSRTVKLMCNGKVVCSRVIQPARTALNYTINGEATPDIPMPDGLVVTETTADSVSLTWNRWDEATEYVVYRNDGLLASVSLPGYTDAGLEENTEYRYRFGAVYGDGSHTALSDEIIAITKVTSNLPPAPPVNLRSVSATENSISLVWDMPVATAPLAFFNLYRGENNGIISALARVPASRSDYHDTGLSASTRYRYFVTASDINDSTSTPGNTLEVTTAAAKVPDAPPAPPVNLRSVSATENSISLVWDMPVATAPLAFFNLYRGENNGIISALARVPASRSDYHDTGLSASTRYRYFVTASDINDSTSTPGNTLEVTTAVASSLPQWVLGGTWQAGEKASYQNREWICIQTHTAWVISWAPGTADSVALWQPA